MGAYHAHDGLSFERLDDGSVEITERVPVVQAREEAEGWVRTGEAVTRRWRLDPWTWASVVASVSAQGETGKQYSRAVGLHAT